jgi:hypothetical protein
MIKNGDELPAGLRYAMFDSQNLTRREFATIRAVVEIDMKVNHMSKALLSRSSGRSITTVNSLLSEKGPEVGRASVVAIAGALSLDAERAIMNILNEVGKSHEIRDYDGRVWDLTLRGDETI